MDEILVTGPEELRFRGKAYRCAVGKNGITDHKKEGDWATPSGSFALRECRFRADRLDAAPKTMLPRHIIEKDDGWCDDPSHASYNRPVKLPFAASHENLWLADHTYDIIIPLGYNDNPVVQGMGSAIFFHLARPDYSPTMGCIAVTLADMMEILPHCSIDTQIRIYKK